MKSTALAFRADDFRDDQPDAEYRGQDPGMYNLQARFIWRVIARHRWIVIGIVGFAVGAAIVSQILATPLYRTSSTVQVELTDEEGANQAEAASRNAQRVENEAKIYHSRAVAEDVVRALDLASNTRFMGSAAKPRDRVTEADRAVATSRLVKMVQVVSNEKSDLIDLAVTAPYPKLAAVIANQYPDSAQQMRITRRQERRLQLLSGLDKQAKRLSDEVSAADRRVADFREKHGMLEGAGGSEDLDQVDRVATEAASADGMRSAMAARSAGVARAASMRSIAGADSPLLQQELREYDALLNEKTRLSSLYGPGYPDMIRVQNELTALDANIKQEQGRARAVAQSVANADAAQQSQLAASESAAAAARSGALRSQLSKMLSSAFANTRNNVELSRLEREADVTRDVYMATHKQAEQVRALLGVVGVNSTLISPATAPTDPVYPSPKKTIAAAFLGSLVLSLLIVFAKEIMDDKVRSVEQVRRWFGLPTFGMFPLIAGFRNTTLEESPVLREPQSLFAEVARSVHSEVADLAKSDETHTVLITSPLPGDGKSTVALSLCAAACAFGRRAIVVDLDLRRPGVLQEMQQQTDGPDLIELLLDPPEQYLLPSRDGENTSREVETYKPTVISVREPVKDPASLLSYRRLNALMDHLREQFDLIVVNGPAALAVRDARTLSHIADHTLMVLRWGRSTIDEVNATMQQMNGKIDGVVFDQVDYAEHARRGYGDSVQFYVDSAAYYTGEVPRSRSLGAWLRRVFEPVGRQWRKV